MRQMRHCDNCGALFRPLYNAHTVCCTWDGPRWIDDAQAYEDAVQHKEWFERLPDCKEIGA